jgi:hypothetical protein
MLKFCSLNEPTESDEQQVLDATCHIFIYATVFQAELHAIKAFRAENAGKT